MKYVRFHEIENVLSSLGMLSALVNLVNQRDGAQQWKWLIIGAHDAVQGAIVCAIADSTGTNVLSKNSAKQILAWLDDTSQVQPREFMADFNTLLKRAGVNLSVADAKDLRKLHSFRNDFAHFTPKAWSIEMAGLPRIIGVAVTLVEGLMNTDRVAYRMSGNTKRRLRHTFGSIRNGLRASDKQCGEHDGRCPSLPPIAGMKWLFATYGA